MYVERDSDVQPDKEQIALGDYLGQLTDELVGMKNENNESPRCDMGVWLCPKVYCLRLSYPNGETSFITKVKGLKLTSECMDQVTIERMKEMADRFLNKRSHGESLNDAEDVMLLPQHQMTADRVTQDIFSVRFHKRMRVVSDKRSTRTGNQTVPHGYRE